MLNEPNLVVARAIKLRVVAHLVHAYLCLHKHRQFESELAVHRLVHADDLLPILVESVQLLLDVSLYDWVHIVRDWISCELLGLADDALGFDGRLLWSSEDFLAYLLCAEGFLDAFSSELGLNSSGILIALQSSHPLEIDHVVCSTLADLPLNLIDVLGDRLEVFILEVFPVRDKELDDLLFFIDDQLDHLAEAFDESTAVVHNVLLTAIHSLDEWQSGIWNHH